MARKPAHEDHANHEAWAIPYGDLITLLLAFFVVMYAISSINEGKYRVLSDSLSEAFGGPPRTIRPINLGSQQVQGSDRDHGPPMQSAGARGPVAPLPLQNWPKRPQVHRDQDSRSWERTDRVAVARAQAGLRSISEEITSALAGLIDKDLVTVRRTEYWVEVEIKSDILFASGSAQPMADALPTLDALAAALAPFPNLVRIEGHTDDVPINTAHFPSNWELSAARAASVLHLFHRGGITPQRMTMIGNGEYRPIADNTTPEGRNANRRVLIVILAHLDEDADRIEYIDGTGRAQPASDDDSGEPLGEPANVPAGELPAGELPAGELPAAGLPAARPAPTGPVAPAPAPENGTR